MNESEGQALICSWRSKGPVSHPPLHIVALLVFSQSSVTITLISWPRPIYYFSLTSLIQGRRLKFGGFAALPIHKHHSTQSTSPRANTTSTIVGPIPNKNLSKLCFRCVLANYCTFYSSVFPHTHFYQGRSRL
jgi:hypothetical protein